MDILPGIKTVIDNLESQLTVSSHLDNVLIYGPRGVELEQACQVVKKRLQPYSVVLDYDSKLTEEEDILEWQQIVENRLQHYSEIVENDYELITKKNNDEGGRIDKTTYSIIQKFWDMTTNYSRKKILSSGNGS